MRRLQPLDAAGEDILPGMIGADMLIQIAALLRPMSAIRALELRFLAALVSRVSQQGTAMLVTLAASLTTIRVRDTLLGHPERQILDRHHWRIEPLLQIPGHNWYARYRRLCKREEEENGRR